MYVASVMFQMFSLSRREKKKGDRTLVRGIERGGEGREV